MADRGSEPGSQPGHSTNILDDLEQGTPPP